MKVATASQTSKNGIAKIIIPRIEDSEISAGIKAGESRKKIPKTIIERSQFAMNNAKAFGKNSFLKNLLKESLITLETECCIFPKPLKLGKSKYLKLS